MTGHQACEAGSQEPRVGTTEKQGGSKAQVGDVIAVRLGDALHEPMEPEAPEIVAHLSRVERLAEDRRHIVAKIAVGEAARLEPKEHQAGKQREDPAIPETQSGGMVRADDHRLVNAAEHVFAKPAVVADSLDVLKTSIGLEADLPQGGPRCSIAPRLAQEGGI